MTTADEVHAGEPLTLFQMTYSDESARDGWNVTVSIARPKFPLSLSIRLEVLDALKRADARLDHLLAAHRL